MNSSEEFHKSFMNPYVESQVKVRPEPKEKVYGVNNDNMTVYEMGQRDADLKKPPAHMHIRSRQEYLDGYVNAGGRVYFESNEAIGTTHGNPIS